jgi:uncharacterized protein YjiS (DUF1127 family)
MKLFNLAVASIVDANTGNGLNRQFIDQYGSNYSTHEKQAHLIRSRSFLGVITNIQNSVRKYIEDSKTKARRHQATKDLLQLNSRLLKDIGLTRDDLHELNLGLTSLETLNARRNFSTDKAKLGQASGRVSSNIRSIGSANQAQYETKKCA